MAFLDRELVVNLFGNSNLFWPSKSSGVTKGTEAARFNLRIDFIWRLQHRAKSERMLALRHD